MDQVVTLRNRSFLHDITSQFNINFIPSATVIVPTNWGIISNHTVQKEHTTDP